MKWIAGTALAALLAGCGVDGAPEPVRPVEADTNMTVRGEASIGVVGVF
ncbi:argininosuccinate lyase [Tranquillimonas alkanivorans]|uniref:Uncharacterized protein n=1 Tax=Tranquillimonas alkanivorans TaxID=441119 RepID=A0A1I5KUY7_9RHOB|nr:argininosuccinate lyase [Tranquillimonas alkanivorans]SFO88844.1 hypothetical protein SAMN04488047_101321 [Tranquillimonas alkanivorans]